jgi:hypothetical protein
MYPPSGGGGGSSACAAGKSAKQPSADSANAASIVFVMDFMCLFLSLSYSRLSGLEVHKNPRNPKNCRQKGDFDADKNKFSYTPLKEKASKVPGFFGTKDFHDLILVLIDDYLRVNPSQFSPSGKNVRGAVYRCWQT